MSSIMSIFSQVKQVIPGLAPGKTSWMKRRIVWLGIIGVLFLAVGEFFPAEFTPTTPELPKEIAHNAAPIGYEAALEEKLASTLSRVKGAGTVAVSITLESGVVQEHAKNITKETRTIQEKDTTGGVRTTTEEKESEQLILSRENGRDQPVMVRERKPVIKGVLVIAEGAYDSTVKAELTKAVAAVLGLPAYKISVLPHRK
jgi:stage III sporulation protein AG